MFRVIYACGLWIGEAVKLTVADLRNSERVYLRQAKGAKDRYVPLPPAMLAELRAFWKTHQHPQFIFPGVGRGWRDGVSALASLATAQEPMGVGSIQTCMRLAVAAARLPQGTVVHTLRSAPGPTLDANRGLAIYARPALRRTRRLCWRRGVSIRLISAYLGHASLETTLVYTHLTAVNEGGARDAIARLLATVSRPLSGPTGSGANAPPGV